VTFRYPGAVEPALRDASVVVREGAVHALLGPNGSGKSTLLQVMLGELAAVSGRVSYRGRIVTAWPRRAIAREIAFVPQSEPLVFPLTVRALVEMGRSPHVGALGRSGEADEGAIESAMEKAGVRELADRSVTELSNGERQRARIARALAQEPTTLVLDEPTASLDLHFEMETFELMTHNLNLAARYATEMALLERGTVCAAGTPEEVLRHDALERVYRWPLTLLRHPGPGRDAGAPQIVPLSRSSG
jgi:iron complex transport system ATP-binding protein